MKPVHADLVNQVLQDVMRGGGTGAPAAIDRPAAGKTGTINENKSVWFAGYTPQLAGAAVVADADVPYQNMIDQRLNGDLLRDVTGGRTAGGIWRDGMRAALQGVEERGFPRPDSDAARGKLRSLPDLGGRDPVDAARILREAGFYAAIASERMPSEHPVGTVAHTFPRDRAQSGSLVTIYVSSGPPVEPKPPEPTKPPPTKPPAPKPTITVPTLPPCPPGRPNCHR